MKRQYSRRLRLYSLCTLAVAGLTMGLSPQVMAAKAKEITLIHVSDVHGHIRSHDEDFITSGNRENAGGVAKLATGIKEIRERVGVENTLTFMVGDATHGGGEVLFTLGNAIMPIFNSLGIDGFVMGNWDWAYGTRVTRNRYVDDLKGTIIMSPNNQTTLSGSIPACTGKAGPDVCNVIPANFDVVANNVYWFKQNAVGA
ncbi:MAG: hypothetical protein ABFS22_13820, partial [Pseudomonadota bacterium]